MCVDAAGLLVCVGAFDCMYRMDVFPCKIGVKFVHGRYVCVNGRSAEEATISATYTKFYMCCWFEPVDERAFFWRYVQTPTIGKHTRLVFAKWLVEFAFWVGWGVMVVGGFRNGKETKNGKQC